MDEIGWPFGEDDEELLEYVLHKDQYMDYKSGKAKENFNTILANNRNKINNEINESKNEVSKTTILDIHGSKYNVEYTINNSEKTLKNSLMKTPKFSPEP